MEDKMATLGYSGTIKMAVCSGNKKLYEKQYKNNGCKPLFRFICECLAGDFKDAAVLRPIRIKLLFNKSASPEAARELIANDKFNDNIIELTNYITMDVRPQVKITENNKESYQSNYAVTFHFFIPSAYLAAAEHNINQVMLYTSEEGKKYTEYDGLLAYYLCTSKDSNETEVWNEIDISSLKGTTDTNIDLEWTMTISNIN